MTHTYPTIPYNGYTWPLTQHMGVLNDSNLYPILWAADNFSTQSDPVLRINEYLVTNQVFTPNVRNDSGQPDAWRDYQQILSELGLIYSTEISKRITLTPIGVAFLDKLLNFQELMVLQALRYQYPNGHKIVISSGLRKELEGSVHQNAKNLVELQVTSDVQIRPAVLIWRVLRELQTRSNESYLTYDEIQSYVLRCTNHADVDACVQAILQSRTGTRQLPPISGNRARRNVHDWVKFLSKTPLFAFNESSKRLSITYYGIGHANEIDNICATLEIDETFWRPGQLDRDDRESWYSFFGSVDLQVQLIPPEDGITTDDSADELELKGQERIITLHTIDPNTLRGLRVVQRDSTTIDVTYDAEIADKQHRLHDRMVAAIAAHFESRGAAVYCDPKTVDVLVQYPDIEFLIEVKSVTPRNTLSRIRHAIGQVLYYDYLRSKSCNTDRRKIVALTARVPDDAWYIDFLNNHLDIDLLALDGQELVTYSSSSIVTERSR